VRRGLYIAVPVEAERPDSWSENPLVVAAVVWSPCYFTGWTAASHWNMTEQVFRTTVLKTARRVRSSHARLLDAEYMVSHTTCEALEWGLERVWHEDAQLRVADPARTVIDILDRPRLGGGTRHAAEILDAYLDEHDAGRLVDYGDRLGNRAVFKRIGYLVDALHRHEPALTQACRQRVSGGLVLLDPDGPRVGARARPWGIRANVTIEPQQPS